MVIQLFEPTSQAVCCLSLIILYSCLQNSDKSYEVPTDYEENVEKNFQL